VDDVPTNARLSNAAEPLVSFVVPAYNEATLLPETLGRIRDLDTEIPYETIVIDGGSDDDTRFPAAAYGAIVVDQEGSGIGAARHQGTERARGQWYAFVDADTELDPSYLDAMLAFVRQKGLVAASSRCALSGPAPDSGAPTHPQPPVPAIRSADHAGVQYVLPPRSVCGGKGAIGTSRTRTRSSVAGSPPSGRRAIIPTSS
jgi:glycosyltransferase involved in cell wall biosynthesis